LTRQSLQQMAPLMLTSSLFVFRRTSASVAPSLQVSQRVLLVSTTRGAAAADFVSM
jgi:hypothetical protein